MMVGAAGSLAAILLAGTAVLAPTSADAACFALTDPGLARRVGRRADTIVLGEVTARQQGRSLTIQVMRTYKGDAPEVMHIDHDSLPPCGYISAKRGDRVVVATGVPIKYPNVEEVVTYLWQESRQGAGWESVWYEWPSLSSLLHDLLPLPDTAAAAWLDGEDPGSPAVPMGLLVTAVGALAFGIRLRQRPFRSA
jgi:hypothetical protein